ENAADVVGQLRGHADQLPAGAQQGAQSMGLEGFDVDAAVPAGADDLRQPFGVIAVSLVELHGQSSLGVASVETDHLQATTTQFVHEPRHQRTSLNTDLEIRAVSA